MELGLVLLRVLLGAILAMHATQKLFGWFHGPGLDTATKIFEGLGQRPGRTMARVAVTCELLAAVLVVLGIVAPFGAAVAAGTMLVAGLSMTWVRGTVWNSAGGGEYPLVLAGVAAVLGFTGPGGWSLDALLRVPWHAPSAGLAAAIGVAVVVVALVAAVPPLTRTRQALAAPKAAGGAAAPA